MSLQRKLKVDLAAARRDGDGARTAVIKTLMAALANAEAVELDASHPKEVQGWAEVPRRRLTTEDVRRILRREAEELRSAADEYEQHGQLQEAARLRRSAAWVDGYVADPSW